MDSYRRRSLSSAWGRRNTLPRRTGGLRTDSVPARRRAEVERMVIFCSLFVLNRNLDATDSLSGERASMSVGALGIPAEGVDSEVGRGFVALSATPPAHAAERPA